MLTSSAELSALLKCWQTALLSTFEAVIQNHVGDVCSGALNMLVAPMSLCSLSCVHLLTFVFVRMPNTDPSLHHFRLTQQKHHDFKQERLEFIFIME